MDCFSYQLHKHLLSRAQSIKKQENHEIEMKIEMFSVLCYASLFFFFSQQNIQITFHYIH